MPRRILVILVVCIALPVLAGCTETVREGNVAFRNDTGVSIEALWIDGSEDLLVFGPLQPGSAVSVGFPGDAEMHTVEFYTETGDLFRLTGILLVPGTTTRIAFSEVVLRSVDGKP